ncbi:hypothetical protein PVA45_06860 [Entomospira entomophila]|uniref:Uncharacterized protein n=1 Tax=Entomospira entomophila TaxID=2719988 RepID=A0A968KU92_9SPIO|nr:DUF6675 family protein [Entomospira entomophilus]NIZ41221.1 hypothetical protein [Entomospira entomophilus]WDI35427.1 hypothetical protein PVA45_06860 [Entomospira entomophilus]
MKNIWLSLSILVICITPIFSQNLRDVVESASADYLFKGGYVFYEYSGIDIHHMKSGVIYQMIQQHIRDMDANFSLEFLYFIPKGKLPAKTNAEILSKILRVETLGSTYMIRNGGKEQVLFKQIEVLNNFKDRKKVSEQIEQKIQLPFEKHMFITLKDARFGKIDYDVTYEASDKFLMISLLNSTPLSYAGKTIATSQAMRLSFMQQELSEGTLYVGHVVGKIHDLEKARKSIHLPSFFSRRIEGLKGWYFQQVYGVKVPQGIYPVAVSLS